MDLYQLNLRTVLDYVAEVRVREQRATPSWSRDLAGDDTLIWGNEGMRPIARMILPFQPDRDFIVHARSDVPKLVDIVEALAKEVSDLRQRLEPNAPAFPSGQ